MEAVAEKGHNLTIVSCDVEKKSPANMHYIHLENMYSFLYNGSSDPLDLIAMANGGPIDELFDYYKFGTVACEGNT
jgi:glucuronosyltransferase